MTFSDKVESIDGSTGKISVGHGLVPRMSAMVQVEGDGSCLSGGRTRMRTLKLKLLWTRAMFACRELMSYTVTPLWSGKSRFPGKVQGRSVLQIVRHKAWT